MVVSNPGSHCTSTTLSTTLMTTLTKISLVNFISNLDFAFQLGSNRLDNIQFPGRLSTRCDV